MASLITFIFHFHIRSFVFIPYERHRCDLSPFSEYCLRTSHLEAVGLFKHILRAVSCFSLWTRSADAAFPLLTWRVSHHWRTAENHTFPLPRTGVMCCRCAEEEIAASGSEDCACAVWMRRGRRKKTIWTNFSTCCACACFCGYVNVRGARAELPNALQVRVASPSGIPLSCTQTPSAGLGMRSMEMSSCNYRHWILWCNSRWNSMAGASVPAALGFNTNNKSLIFSRQLLGNSDFRARGRFALSTTWMWLQGQVRTVRVPGPVHVNIDRSRNIWRSARRIEVRKRCVGMGAGGYKGEYGYFDGGRPSLASMRAKPKGRYIGYSG